MPKCETCGKNMKNAFAMKIHVGRMHKKGKAAKTGRIAKPAPAAARLDIGSLGVDQLIAMKQQVDGRLADVARRLRRAGVMGGKTGRKPKVQEAAQATMAPVAKPDKKAKAPAAKAKAPAKRGVFPETAEQFILGLAKGKGATTAQVNQKWSESGRPGSASPNLSILFKARKLKREPLGGKKGFLYSVAGVMGNKPGRKAMAPVAKVAAVKKGVYSESATALILRLLAGPPSTGLDRWRAGGKPVSTIELAAAWKKAGRKDRPSKTLSEMVKAKKIKREVLKGVQANNYTLA